MHQKQSSSNWCVYMLLLSNNALYTGITNNLAKRLAVHRNGKGSKYVRAHLPFITVYTEDADNKSAALKRERSIKKMHRVAKEIMIWESIIKKCTDKNKIVEDDMDNDPEPFI
jgi:putative endonuclease